MTPGRSPKGVADAAAETDRRQRAGIRPRLGDNHARMRANGVSIAEPARADLMGAPATAAKDAIAEWRRQGRPGRGGDPRGVQKRAVSHMSHSVSPTPGDFQLVLDALNEGAILWTPDGRVLVANAAASRLFGLPDGLVVRGARRVEVMTYMARRGDYGATDDPERLAQELSARFATGAITSLTRPLPNGRHLRADSQPLDDGRLLVVYREVAAPEA
jgi:PAS domain-containing protein